MTLKTGKIALDAGEARPIKRFALPGGAAGDELSSLFGEILEAARNGDTVEIASFGSLTLRSRAEPTLEASAKSAAASETPPEFLRLDLDPDNRKQPSEITFGSVAVRGVPPPADVVERNIATGHAALERGLLALRKPGVNLPRRRDVPYFRADPADPSILIRELNGREDRVELVDGAFKTVG